LAVLAKKNAQKPKLFNVSSVFGIATPHQNPKLVVAYATTSRGGVKH